MRIGTRITQPEDVERWNAEIYQISMYRGLNDDIEIVRKCSESCKKRDVPNIIHPVGFPLLQDVSFSTLESIAAIDCEAMVLHDERGFDGKRLSGEDTQRYREAVTKLNSLVPLSFENAMDTRDVLWFWEHFTESITLDIGHVEAAGLNSVEFVCSLNGDILNRIGYVHMHHNGEFRNGLTDHHPLKSNCRELDALTELVKRKGDVAVILEINETDMINDSLDMLRELRRSIV